jgi:phage-related protein
MMKGIKFDNTHSYDDLNLVLSKVDIPPAAVKTTYVDIPGGDGSIDLTEALGEVRYKDRVCKFTFTVFPYDDFEEKKKEISNLLNGKRCRIIVDKDPDYYWDGRCSIDNYASDKNIHQIVVGAIVAPYKLKVSETTVFVPAGVNLIGRLWNGRRTIVPAITNTADAKITFNGVSYMVDAGTHKILNIELVEGINVVEVTSVNPVKFTYQEGDL